jgi:NAD(P)-dependent dehydrogenase (short-subunit alcohol dehydrogenase family)
VTGGTGGIGLATCSLLVDRGVRVLTTGSSGETVDRARAELGDGAVVVESDAASTDAIDELVDRARSEFGKVDLLFLNAGIARDLPFEEFDEGSYDLLFAVNARGPYFAAQRFLPLMGEGSSVVLTTSVANVLGFPLASAYAASKAAVRSMARTLARELQPRGIRVNAVSPGPTATAVLDKAMSREAAEETRARLREAIPMGRLGLPEEVAKAVLFLAFEATFTTGAELPVDGGVSQL